jgi:hypothetical protein
VIFCPSARPGINRRDSLWTKFPLSGNFGGGGSRTPVRKALRHEAYMLSSVPVAIGPLRAHRAFAFRAQNEQETRPASPIGLAWRSGPKRFGQSTV